MFPNNYFSLFRQRWKSLTHSQIYIKDELKINLVHFNGLKLLDREFIPWRVLITLAVSASAPLVVCASAQSAEKNLTPPTPLPYLACFPEGVGRGEYDSPLLAGEGLGERFAQIPTIPPNQDPSPQRPSDNLPQPQIPTPTPPAEEIFPIPIPPTPEPIPGEIPETITVKKFEFEGNTVISEAELAEATAKFTNRPLPFAEVFEVRAEITRLYRENRSPSIGTFEREVTLAQANLTGEGDNLTFSYSNTQGNHTLDASYTYPINPRNGTLKGRINFSFSHVVEPPFDRIDIDADAQYYELTLRQPIRQTLNREFAIGVTASHQSSDTTIFNIPFRLSPGADENGRTSVTALRFFQEWINRSNKEVFSARSQFTLGLGILGATTNDSGPDSNFLSWRGQTQWVRLLGSETLLILRGDIQLSTNPLLRLEQFGLGGEDTLRGYRQSSFLSDNGVSASGEMRFPLFHLGENGLLQLAPFIDVGMVWNNSGNPDPDPEPNILVSTGLGLRLSLGSRLSARFDWGIPLVDVTSSGDTLQEEGFYFSVNYRFFN